MEFRINQLASQGQEEVLSALARLAAKKGCVFLEVGSWLGDSTIILAKIAKEKNGHVFCVDWWNGSIGTELVDIASSKDVFSAFWRRVCGEGLEDTIIPIRSKSDIAVSALKKEFFDLVFIDADHRYEAVFADIKNCLSLVKRPGGILCGHDCEGRITDFERKFLELGKNNDVYESVHCGVVLAVGETFADYSIDSGIWSVKAKEEGWGLTALEFKDGACARQPLPPPLGSTANYDLYRYGDSIYAVPKDLKGLDITKEDSRKLPQVVRAKSIKEAENAIREDVLSKDFPVLLGAYMGFNLVRYKERIYGVDQALGELDLVRISAKELKEHQRKGSFVIADTANEAKLFILGIKHEILKKALEEKEKALEDSQTKILRAPR